ncbi:CPCC family cysteine-rich protein [Streptomyces sp. NPDC058200]|uniref:CPCC family cysteine-rich protein n=1 Tax=Streptomyces sp. NPDC058200 TaxID=3346378 RepID=UPI0036E189B0
MCPVCFREGDGVQFRWPTMDGGANKVSLIEAQHSYQDFGACDQHGRRDSFEDWEADHPAPWPDNHSVLCWWLPAFWRRHHPAAS